MVRRIASFVIQVVRDFAADNGPQWAAAIAYYALLSLFPLLLAAASVASLFVSTDWAVEHALALLGRFVPRGSADIRQIVSNALAARGTVSAISLMALLATGSRVFGAATRALNVAFDVDDSYSFWQRILVEIAMMLTLGLFYVLALGSRLFSSLVPDLPGLLPQSRGLLFTALSWLLPVLLLLVAFFLTYRFVPRRRPDWRAALAGAVLATLLFEAAPPLFLLYIGNFGQYNLIYGSIALPVILIIWTWLVALILLIGGELASHIQALLIDKQPAAEVARRHKARSPDRSAAEQSAPPAQAEPRKQAALGEQGPRLKETLLVVGAITAAALLGRRIGR